MRRTVTLSLALLPFILVLGWAAAGVALAGGGCHSQTEPLSTEGKSVVVKLEGCTFSPTITRVPIGTEVRFVNTSDSAHDVTGRKGEWGSASLALGGSYIHRFTSAGVYPYSCSIHPGMAGVVAVGSPGLSLASEVQPAPIEPVPASAADATLPILAAGGLGILAGALVAGAFVSRRREVG